MSEHEKVIDLVLESAQSITDDEELNKFFLKMAALSIAALRGINGIEFVDDFLAAALNEEDKLVVRPPRKH